MIVGTGADGLKIMDDDEDVSGAGNMMGCDNDAVVEAFTLMNAMRAEQGLKPLGCSNRASGAAENWSEMACEAYALFRSVNLNRILLERVHKNSAYSTVLKVT